MSAYDQEWFRNLILFAARLGTRCARSETGKRREMVNPGNEFRLSLRRMTSFWPSIEGDLLPTGAARVVTLTNLYQEFDGTRRGSSEVEFASEPSRVNEPSVPNRRNPYSANCYAQLSVSCTNRSLLITNVDRTKG